MKNYAKVGGRKGKPGYRTPAVFRVRKSKMNQQLKNHNAGKRK